MKYNYAFMNLPTEGLKRLRNRFAPNKESENDNLYRVIGKAVLVSSLRFRKQVEEEKLDYLQIIGIQTSAQAYEAQLFGNMVGSEYKSLEGIESEFNEYLIKEMPHFVSSNGSLLPGNARSTMILNNLPESPNSIQYFYTRLGKIVYNTLLDKSNENYATPKPTDERSIAVASLSLESLIRGAIVKAIEDKHKFRRKY